MGQRYALAVSCRDLTSGLKAIPFFTAQPLLKQEAKEKSTTTF
jgi:hypothetical protein